MHLKSPYPEPTPLGNVNAHYIFFKRPDQVEWPNYTVHIDPTNATRVMYRDYVRNIEDLSTGLAAPVSEGGMGLEAWEEGIVGIMGENSSEYLTLIHACLRIAVPFALISSYSTPFELKHALKLSKATRIFADAKFLKTLLPVAKEAGIPQDRIHILKDTISGSKHKVPRGKAARRSLWSIIEDVRKRKTPTVDIRPAGKNTLAYLVFSSGTSGLPKAVMISHGNIIFSISQALVVVKCNAAVYTPPVPANPEGLGVTLAFLPLHHTYGLHAYAFRSSLIPSTYVILPRWDIKLALQVIPKYQVTTVNLIPSVVHQLVHYPGIEKADFSTVLSLSCGAAYLPQELADKLTKLVPDRVQFGEGYGMSEGTIAAVVQPLDGVLGKYRRISGCTGILLPGMEAVLIKDDVTTPPSTGIDIGAAGCKVNEHGELWLRGENIALGYWNNPKANGETFVNGWLKTGDRFRVDEEGYFWYADRAKDTLKVSGAQVSPVEIEDCLLAHPAKLITDVTVAGVSGGRTEDEKVPHAWIVLSDIGKSREWGKAKVIKELTSWHQEHLSKYKWLRGGFDVVDEIPKSPTGKVLRRVLQDRYEAHVKKHGRKNRAKL
ncbi:acetyl-CoA synthetase-like protein [Pholiota conissans]|uniref:Acetyl-CoA synthetase-like protein n=1 Tax=Pholiota conissans TaxID=109636 RepID=A0A9P6D5F5_9AGAR|nr:acetyl-CoA synthetase-like protein [Pholiota conissans]